MSVMNKLIGNVNAACENVVRGRVLPCLQFVRWRKPRFVPRAKSKEFVLSKKYKGNKKEHEWFTNEMRHYRTDIKNIWEHIKYIPDMKVGTEGKNIVQKGFVKVYPANAIPDFVNVIHEGQSASNSEEDCESIEDSAEDYSTAYGEDDVIVINRYRDQWESMQQQVAEWNKKVAVKRNADERKQDYLRQKKVQAISKRDTDIAKQFQKETLDRLHQEQRDGYFLPENVEEKILDSLEKTSDYDFALDRKGFRHLELPEKHNKEETKKS